MAGAETRGSAEDPSQNRADGHIVMPVFKAPTILILVMKVIETSVPTPKLVLFP